ncbi:DinB family protein [Paenibacillus sp. GP183]|uniref:DinB family protein n=1 Tax=Paenibacillus sp. GP183 TaxID=1882751 RepID=UPI000899558C|nr:DinB family protein [Paenibacillus sp. GP183]SEC78381.1 Uncharacterized damage-inducible protein DinB (forms a four-helix bundle) [Paenibacillus sp. GP183]
MFVTVENFIEEYREETKLTQKLLDSLTDDSLKQEVAPGYRTLGFLAWHLVPSGGILHQVDLRFDTPTKSAEAPESAVAIARAYRSAAQAVMDTVRSQWTDEKLQEPVSIFGQQWKNGFVLDMFLRHEVHHRGQLTLLMRQAGLPITGVYGPSKEEWEQMGMKAPV